MSKIAFINAVLFLALVAAPAAAEPLVLTGSSLGFIQNDPPPAMLTFDLGKVEFTPGGSSFIIPIASGAIPGIGYTTGLMTWIIDASNAASYGFDWAAAQADIVGPEKRRLNVGINGLGSHSTLLHSSIGDRLVSFDMERLEIDLRWYNVTHEFNAYWRFYGDGLVVPEPHSWIMGFLGLLSVVGSPRVWLSKAGHLR